MKSIFTKINKMIETQSNSEKNNYRWDLAITWITASLIYGFLLIFAFCIYQHRPETSFIWLSVFLGVSLGWFLGILATPYNLSEQKRLSDINKVAYGFLTGYLISKIDAVLNALMSTEDLLRKERLWVFVVVLVIALLATFITTYVNRSYWLITYWENQKKKKSLDSAENPEQKINTSLK
jgi:uncharacterized membrane protein